MFGRILKLAFALCAGFSACTPLSPGDQVVRDAAMDLDSGQHDAGHESEHPEPTPEAGPPTDAGSDAGSSTMGCKPPGQRGNTVKRMLEITEDTRWTCETDYELVGAAVVRAGTLTIDPGVRIKVRNGSGLVISKEARLVAAGTAQEPIVFTAVEHPAQPGAWRGVFLLGKAPTSLPETSSLGLSAADISSHFGGSDVNHDCGQLEHVRIEFAGGLADEYAFPSSALTLAGCGRKTSVHDVQIHAATDGLGLIGGQAPIKRVLVTAATADGIEWTAGYSGLLQFVVVQSFYGAGAALKGSQDEGKPDSTPPSSPIIFNATLVGANAKGLPRGVGDPNGLETGILLQAGTRATIRNSVVYGFAGSWVDIIDVVTAQHVGTDLTIRNTIFGGPEPRMHPGFPGTGAEPGDGTMDDDGSFSEDQTFREPSLQNRFPPIILQRPFDPPPLRPDFSADSYVNSSNLEGNVPTGWEGVFESAAYAGALPKIEFEADRALDWTQAEQSGEPVWTDFPQE
ncbi:MAG: hypothetical protein QM778_10570 [Myxococcales bacterium]